MCVRTHVCTRACVRSVCSVSTVMFINASCLSVRPSVRPSVHLSASKRAKGLYHTRVFCECRLEYVLYHNAGECSEGTSPGLSSGLQTDTRPAKTTQLDRFQVSIRHLELDTGGPVPHTWLIVSGVVTLIALHPHLSSSVLRPLLKLIGWEGRYKYSFS